MNSALQRSEKRVSMVFGVGLLRHFQTDDDNMYSRVAREYNDLQANPENGCDVYHDCLTRMDVIIAGPVGSYYEKGTFMVSIDFDDNYPLKPPKVRFKTQIFHFHIKTEGAICMASLKDHWSPALRIRNILEGLMQCLTLKKPNQCKSCVGGGEIQSHLHPKYLSQLQLQLIVDALYWKCAQNIQKLSNSLNKLISEYSKMADIVYCGAYEAYEHDPALYEKIAREWTAKHAM